MKEKIKKSEENLTEAKKRERYGSFASIVGIVTNFILSGIKFLAGILSGSLAIMADAVNNISDAGSSAVTLVSFKLSAKPADRDHPFGHARIEYIASMIVSFIILKVGIDFLFDSVKKIFVPSADELKIEILTIIILSSSILMKLGLAAFYRIAANKIDSSSLRAASADSLFDVISTTAVLVSSVVVKLTGITLIDAIVGVGVSVLILVAGINILNEMKNSLLGEAPVEGMVSEIEGLISEYTDIIGIHDMMIHNYGPKHYIASFHAEVDGSRDVFEMHDVIDNVEKDIHQRLGILCTIHMDPLVTNDEKLNELKKLVNDVIAKIDTTITVHDFRAVVGNTHTNLIFDVVLPFESKYTENDIKALISAEVSNVRHDCFCVITVDRG